MHYIAYFQVFSIFKPTNSDLIKKTDKRQHIEKNRYASKHPEIKPTSVKTENKKLTFFRNEKNCVFFEKPTNSDKVLILLKSIKRGDRCRN